MVAARAEKIGSVGESGCEVLGGSVDRFWRQGLAVTDYKSERMSIFDF